MTDALRVHDEWLLLPERMALHEPTATAVIADVHLGYSARRRRLGDAVPLPGMAGLLAPVGRAVARRRIERLVVAGDLFERGVDADLFRAFVGTLAGFKIAFAGLVPGNHDRLADDDVTIPRWPTDETLGGWLLRHGDGPMGEEKFICGHWHPGAFVAGRKRPCFLVGPNRIVLPAYSRDAAGVGTRAAPWAAGCRRVAIVEGELIEGGGGGVRGRRRR